MERTINLIGQRFGKLVVVEKMPYKSKNRAVLWKCRCDCGNDRIATSGHLRHRDLTSCGCEKKEHLEGQRFGRWTVIKRSEKPRKWICQCDCGTIKEIASYTLKNGNSQSCGCLRTELSKERYTTHGKKDTRLYVVWCNMRRRCFNEKAKHYKNYGGRGISVCEEWLGKDGFIHFFEWAYENGYDENAEYGKCTIDRIDVNGNYQPSNCRWVDAVTQANNTRTNRKITINGTTHTISEWSKISGVKRGTIAKRLKTGFSPKESLQQGRKERRKCNLQI